MFKLILTSWILVIVLMAVIWLFYLKTKNPGIIDVAWSLAIMACGLNYMLKQKISLPTVIFTTLLLMWGLRLSIYLLITRIIPQHVDKRYSDMSKEWKINKALGYFFNYQFQGILAVIIATPFLFIGSQTSLKLCHWIAAAIVIIGMIGEVIADTQLNRFKATNRGKVCNVGLWLYSRHPNYFFEWLIWIGFATAGLSTLSGLFGIISPLLLLILMLKLTGPITEKNSIKSRGQAFIDYQKRTSMFIPLPPKKD